MKAFNRTLQRGHFTEEGRERCLPATTLVQRKMQLKQNLSATRISSLIS